ncbi:SDR family NAD(P)-dependent oxidoreductase [Aeromicrobium sp. CTD01-1L150]|uniref:SDR family NAD(P)-dependent oxidoreductase n=1 Tax=Aeromicrobium sp. CTD01-1L150 TaxID=3341830 RepID=UPI0035C26D99
MSRAGLQGKVVAVTGAGQGIGAAYVRRFVADGCHVVAADLNGAAAQEVAATTSGPGTVEAFEFDVADASSCRGIARHVDSSHGRLDGLVNNAAIFSTIAMKPFWEIPELEWDRLMAVNLKGPWLLVSAVLDLLRAAPTASVVNVGSDAVQMGRSGYLHYVASKGGVHGMTFSMARELGEFGIRVNTLSPGPVYTEVDRGTVSPEQKQAMLAAQALDRPAGPDDMTALAAFLISDESAYVTGQTYSVNGGLVHR